LAYKNVVNFLKKQINVRLSKTWSRGNVTLQGIYSQAGNKLTKTRALSLHNCIGAQVLDFTTMDRCADLFKGPRINKLTQICCLQ